jgi:hypothetical protein
MPRAPKHEAPRREIPYTHLHPTRRTARTVNRSLPIVASRSRRPANAAGVRGGIGWIAAATEADAIGFKLDPAL